MPFASMVSDGGSGLVSGTASAPPAPSTGLPPGFDDPVAAFGYDPATIAIPADPAGWPSVAVANHYYIDPSDGSATDTTQGGEAVDAQSRRWGSPDIPRSTVPDTDLAVAGQDVVLHLAATNHTTAAFRYDFTSAGTSTGRIFVRGLGAGASFLKTVRTTGAQHHIFDNIQPPTDRDAVRIESASEYITVRNSTMTGAGTSQGNAATIGISGTGAGRTQYVMVCNNTIQDWGDHLSASENDYHGCLPSEYVSHVWFMNNTGRRNGGDTIQIGQASTTGAARPQYVYVGNNNTDGDRENGVDVKGALDIFIARNTVRNNRAVSSSAGEGIVVHNDAEYIWIYDNDVADCDLGIIATSGTNVYALHNRVHRITGAANGTSAYTAGVGITYRGSPIGDLIIAQNTIHGCDKNVTLDYGGSGVTCRVSANAMGATLYQSVFAVGSDETNQLTMDHNAYEDMEVNWGGAVYDNPASFNAAQGQDANGVEGALLLSDPVNGDFALGVGSAARDVGGVDAAYALFQTRYSRTLDTDLNDTVRPTDSTRDAGSLEAV